MMARPTPFIQALRRIIAKEGVSPLPRKLYFPGDRLLHPTPRPNRYSRLRVLGSALLTGGRSRALHRTSSTWPYHRTSSANGYVRVSNSLARTISAAE